MKSIFRPIKRVLINKVECSSHVYGDLCAWFLPNLIEYIVVVAAVRIKLVYNVDHIILSSDESPTNIRVCAHGAPRLFTEKRSSESSLRDAEWISDSALPFGISGEDQTSQHDIILSAASLDAKECAVMRSMYRTTTSGSISW
jgi:hypothetical protein